ncbi:hypothetical protein AOT41_09755 [Limosilactobacillus fermentum]|nr:hypothetical protein AOT41_09755 [Limosilactobacillus fermentum]
MTDYIKNILQIKDPNLHFTDVVFENNDGWETQVFAMNESWQFLHLRRCLPIRNIVGQLSLIERYLMVW